MSDLSELPEIDGLGEPLSAIGSSSPIEVKLSKPERAAIILGVLGTEAATPILEQLDEHCHRSFANAMTRLERIDPATVEVVIREFVADLESNGVMISGGLERAREMLQQVTDAKKLDDILDEADRPNARNVWEKLEKIEDDELAEMLEREHPQTAAVIVDRLPADKSAAVLDKLSIDAACRVVLGLNRAAKLSPKVVHAIGQSVSNDFLAGKQRSGKRETPADKIGAIMNFAAGEMRTNVLGFLGRTEPDLLAEVRRKMFTFEDIPDRIEKRDITAVIRATPNEVLLPALAGASENAPTALDYILANISSRVADQIREEMEDLGKVKLRTAEEAQSKIINIIRGLQTEGVLTLVEPDD